jgi:tetratricopeptide (TPR) repeat protein
LVHRSAGDEAKAQEAWQEGLCSLPIKGNNRMQAWRANLLAAVGRKIEAEQAINLLLEDDPHNGYLRYRLAHVLAETGRLTNAVDMLSQAVAEGLLSAQLLRQELSMSLAPLQEMPGFNSVLQTLEAEVSRCGRQYAAGLPATFARGKDLRL